MSNATGSPFAPFCACNTNTINLSCWTKLATAPSRPSSLIDFRRAQLWSLNLSSRCGFEFSTWKDPWTIETRCCTCYITSWILFIYFNSLDTDWHRSRLCNSSVVVVFYKNDGNVHNRRLENTMPWIKLLCYLVMMLPVASSADQRFSYLQESWLKYRSLKCLAYAIGIFERLPSGKLHNINSWGL